MSVKAPTVFGLMVTWAMVWSLSVGAVFSATQ